MVSLQDCQPQSGLKISVSVVNVMNSCPPDPLEAAEAAYMGRLDQKAAGAFEAHVEVCAKCCRIYEGVVAFIDAIRKSSADVVRMER